MMMRQAKAQKPESDKSQHASQDGPSVCTSSTIFFLLRVSRQKGPSSPHQLVQSDLLSVSHVSVFSINHTEGSCIGFPYQP